MSNLSNTTWVRFLHNYLTKNTFESGHQITLFGIVMMINFPLFGILWRMQDFQVNQEFFLRLVATILCILLVSHRFWNDKILRLLPYLWYATLFFCLPFFFTYLTLLNHGATLWLMNCMSAIFFLFLVVSALDSIILLAMGIGLAFLCYLYDTNNTLLYLPGSISFFGLSITTVAAVIIGALFSRDRELFHSARISEVRLFADSLAHDLRTPLTSISLHVNAQEKASEAMNSPDARLRFAESINKIKHCVNSVNQLISMQMNNIRCEKFDTHLFAIYSIKELLSLALEDYPYQMQEKEKIHVDLTNDYIIWVSKEGFVNFIWNLLKNAFSFIKEAKKGGISIWYTEGESYDNFNYLHIKDTAKGVSPTKAKIIFEPFYTERKGGTGIGLAYCKAFIEASKGEISCQGQLGEYAHFIVKFPKVE